MIPEVKEDNIIVRRHHKRSRIILQNIYRMMKNHGNIYMSKTNHKVRYWEKNRPEATRETENYFDGILESELAKPYN